MHLLNSLVRHLRWSRYRVYDELLSWDGKSEEWVVESRLPERRAYGGLAVLGDELWYCSGATGREGHSGSGDDRPPVHGCMIYSPTTKQWREGPRLNTPRVETAAFTANGRIYMFGGSTRSLGGETIDVVESIGLGEDQWKVEPFPMPVGLRQFGGAVLDEKIYLIGGLDNHPENHPTDAIPTHRAFLCFDPQANTWEHDVVSYNGQGEIHRPSLGPSTLPRHPSEQTQQPSLPQTVLLVLLLLLIRHSRYGCSHAHGPLLHGTQRQSLGDVRESHRAEWARAERPRGCGADVDVHARRKCVGARTRLPDRPSVGWYNLNHSRQKPRGDPFPTTDCRAASNLPRQSQDSIAIIDPHFTKGRVCAGCASFQGMLLAISGSHGVHTDGGGVFDPRVWVLKE